MARSFSVLSAFNTCLATLWVGVCGSRSAKSAKRGTFGSGPRFYSVTGAPDSIDRLIASIAATAAII